jgi:hypothetical protein
MAFPRRQRQGNSAERHLTQRRQGPKAQGEGIAIKMRLPRQKHPVARWPQRGILRYMDWLKIAALSVVAATAGLFLWAKLRPRKFSFERDTHCGCPSTNSAGAKTSIVFSARKDGRAKIIMKNR